jgi:hypothetical protein
VGQSWGNCPAERGASFTQRGASSSSGIASSRGARHPKLSSSNVRAVRL